MLSFSAAWTWWQGKGELYCQLFFNSAHKLALREQTSYFEGMWRWLWSENVPCQGEEQRGWKDWQEVSGHICFFYPVGSADRVYSLLCPHRDTARLVIRKIQFAPSQVGAGPKADICKSFMMSDKPVHLEASMEKDVISLMFVHFCHILFSKCANRNVFSTQLYFHGEEIPLKIKINNESNKTVKKIKITGGYFG